jgi:hypothetical protein
LKHWITVELVRQRQAAECSQAMNIIYSVSSDYGSVPNHHIESALEKNSRRSNNDKKYVYRSAINTTTQKNTQQDPDSCLINYQEKR